MTRYEGKCPVCTRYLGNREEPHCDNKSCACHKGAFPHCSSCRCINIHLGDIGSYLT